MKNTGYYIAIEGPPGSGKTTQVELLANRLDQLGFLVHLLGDPIEYHSLLPDQPDTETQLDELPKLIIEKARLSGYVCIADGNHYLNYRSVTPDILINLDTPSSEVQARNQSTATDQYLSTAELMVLENIRADYLIRAKTDGALVIHNIDSPNNAHDTIWEIVGGKISHNNEILPLPPPTPFHEMQQNNQVAQTNKRSSLFFARLLSNSYQSKLKDIQFSSVDKLDLFIPKSLDATSKKIFKNSIIDILKIRGHIVGSLTKEGRPELAKSIEEIGLLLLPLAIYTNLTPTDNDTDIYHNLQTINISQIESYQYIKTRNGLNKSLSNYRNLIKFANKYLFNLPSDTNTSARLLRVSPVNEFDTLPHLLFTYSTQSLDEITSQINTTSYSQKYEIIHQALNLNENIDSIGLLGDISYDFEVITSTYVIDIIKDIIGVDQIIEQPLSPLLGYNVPMIIEEIGLTDSYIECFDKSLELYSQLQKQGKLSEAQYTTLLGHNTRMSMSISPKELKQLIHSPIYQESIQFNKTTSDMIAIVQERHPIIAQFITG